MNHKKRIESLHNAMHANLARPGGWPMTEADYRLFVAKKLLGYLPNKEDSRPPNITLEKGVAAISAIELPWGNSYASVA